MNCKKLVLLVMSLLILTMPLAYAASDDVSTSHDADECEDSDGGKNYYKKGTTSWCPSDNRIGMACSAFIDNCEDGVLTEGYCNQSNKVSTEKYQCPNGCEDGRCIEIIGFKLGDVNSDGKIDSTDTLMIQSFVKGLTKFDSSQKTKADVNLDGMITYLDSYAVLLYDTGIITVLPHFHDKYGDVNKDDKVDSTDALIILTFLETKDLKGFKNIANADMNKDGDITRKDADLILELEVSKCVDSDGGKNYYKKGTTSWCPSDNRIGMACSAFIDNCEDGVLTEGYCNQSNKVSTEKYQCPNGCEDGRCIVNECPKIEVLCQEGTVPEYYIGEDGCKKARCVPIKQEIYVYLNEKFELREQQSAKVVDYRNMKLKLNNIIKECYATTTNVESASDIDTRCELIGAHVQVEMPSDCVISSSVSNEACPSTGTRFILKEGESKEVFGAKVGLLDLKQNVAVFVVQKDTEKDYVDVYIEPEVQTISYGDYAKYEITVVDKHSGIICVTAPCPQANAAYPYQIVVGNLPFLKEYEKQITLEAGEKKSFDLIVKPYNVIQEVESEIECSDDDKDGVCNENVKVSKITRTQARITGNAVASSQGAQYVSGEAAILEEVVDISKPYYVREYKFNVRATLLGNSRVQDVAYGVLRIKPKEPVIPPVFPKEEVEIKLYRGWNLISLPGKLVSFEGNGLQRKLLGFVYLKEEQRYVTLKEAQRILGSEFKEHIATNAFWVYSYMDYTLKVKIDKEISFENIKLNPGWNLVPITEDMVGGYLSDLKGDCDFEKLYKWEAQEQSWEGIIEEYVFKYDGVNKGIIIKAKDYCTIGGVTITKLTPPVMPE